MPETSQDTSTPSTPRLRLLQGEGSPRAALHGEESGSHRGATQPAPRLVDEGAPLLIVGADPARRAALVHQLTHTMPTGTSFEELSTFAQVLERAPLSRMVILSGGLEDISARSLMRILGQRHPRLPVVSLEAPRPRDL
jgi:hypothetical protein